MRSYFFIPNSETLCVFYLFIFKFYFSWRIIALQCCVGFCYTTTCFSHKHAHIPSLLSLPPPHPHMLVMKPLSPVGDGWVSRCAMWACCPSRPPHRLWPFSAWHWGLCLSLRCLAGCISLLGRPEGNKTLAHSRTVQWYKFCPRAP